MSRSPQSTPSRKERAAVYQAAAMAMEKKQLCGCCEALEHKKGAFEPFAALFKPEDAGPGDFWWGGCACELFGNPETRDPRVIALCLMAAMVESGDA